MIPTDILLLIAPYGLYKEIRSLNRYLYNHISKWKCIYIDQIPLENIILMKYMQFQNSKIYDKCDELYTTMYQNNNHELKLMSDLMILIEKKIFWNPKHLTTPLMTTPPTVRELIQRERMRYPLIPLRLLSLLPKQLPHEELNTNEKMYKFMHKNAAQLFNLISDVISYTQYDNIMYDDEVWEKIYCYLKISKKFGCS